MRRPELRFLFYLSVLPAVIAVVLIALAVRKPPVAGVTTADQAASIAREEAVKQGWKEVELSPPRLEGRVWLVRVDRLPMVFGGNALVQISTNGDAIRFIRGL